MTQALRNRFITEGAATISQERLLLALLDRVLVDLDRADAALDREPAVAHAALVNAQRILEELHFAVDTSVWPDGQSMREVYAYVHDRLITANVTKDRTIVRECREVMEPVVRTWHDAYSTFASSEAAVVKTTDERGTEYRLAGTWA